jgi:hypothetical protein
MTDLICPFSATLVRNDFACHCAEQIIRRGGAEIACLSEHRYTQCQSIHQKIKSEALHFMGLDDDLLSLPHSVLVKIQFGGLLALQAATGNDTGKINDIASLIETVNGLFGEHAMLPFDTINRTIADYKISRRGRK